MLVFLAVCFACQSSTPSLAFTQDLLKEKQFEQVQTFEIFEKVVGSGKSRTLLYSYRSFKAEKNFTEKGETQRFHVEGQIRCYPEYKPWSALVVDVPERDYCRLEVLNKTPLTKETPPPKNPKDKTTKP